jgi:hypothetical protein
MNAQTTKSESSFGSTELTERAIYRRAVETVIWGMPAVNYYRMLQAAIANGAKANQVVYWSRPVNWKDQTLTPNPDTIYLNPLYDTTGGPVVIEIPPAEGDAAIVGSVDDAWQNALEDIGSAGVDKGKGGKFLITPPGYTEKTPEGYVALPSQTYRGFLILRSNFKSRSNADIEAAVAHGKRVKMCPLGASADSTVYVDVYDKSFDATIPYDVTFFELLDHFVQAEPWLTRDKVIIDILKTLGNGWNISIDNVATYGTSYLQRAAVALGGLGANLPEDAIYPVAFVDSEGKPLDGADRYVVHFNKGRLPPADAFWSLTMYDGEGFQVPNPLDRFAIGDRDKLKFNDDGSLDIYIQTDSPGKDRESNWLPAPKSGPIGPTLRIYSPRQEVLDGSWTPPPVQRAKQ